LSYRYKSAALAAVARASGSRSSVHSSHERCGGCPGRVRRELRPGGRRVRSRGEGFANCTDRFIWRGTEGEALARCSWSCSLRSGPVIGGVKQPCVVVSGLRGAREGCGNREDERYGAVGAYPGTVGAVGAYGGHAALGAYPAAVGAYPAQVGAIGAYGGPARGTAGAIVVRDRRLSLVGDWIVAGCAECLFWRFGSDGAVFEVVRFSLASRFPTSVIGHRTYSAGGMWRSGG